MRGRNMVIPNKFIQHYSKLIYFLLLSLGFLSITGCSRYVKIYLQAATDLNNGGNPVVVRLYQLTTDVNFKNETSESFWRNEKNSFDRDMVGKPQEIMLHPREVLKLEKVKVLDDTKYIGVAADFYKPDKDQWHYLIDISMYEGDELLVVVRKNTLVITEVKE
jgi:type VI secretion system VasD/TssJ family lipoprotein